MHVHQLPLLVAVGRMLGRFEKSADAPEPVTG
jgi:hypothetical protein